MKEDNMLVTFENIDKEFRWSALLFALENEYTLSIKDVCQILKCNRSWVSKYIKPNVHHIYINNGFGNGKNFRFHANRHLGVNDTESLWFSEEEFYQLIKTYSGTITRQTIKIPIELLIDQKKMSYFKKNYISYEDLNNELRNQNYDAYDKKCEIRKNVIEKCLSEIGEEFMENEPNRYKRSAAPALPSQVTDIDPRNFLAVHDLKNYGDVDETIYRDLFMRGCHKIILRLPDQDGCISEKIYYYEETDAEFTNIETLDKILVRYDMFLKLFPKMDPITCEQLPF